MGLADRWERPQAIRHAPNTRWGCPGSVCRAKDASKRGVKTTPGGVRQHGWEVLSTFLKVGALNYGGASVGIIQAEVQDKRGWVSKAQFLEGLALVNTLPGPSGIQIGIFVGYARAGWWGGVLAGLGFILPGSFSPRI